MSTTNTNNVSTPVRMNIGAIEASWSPLDARKGRDDEGRKEKMKVRSLNGNTRALRGGDWLSSCNHGLMTLGVAWTEHSGKKYGLTVAHPFAYDGLAVGDSVFAFDSDAPTTMRDGTTAYKSIRVGTIVSIDKKGTDSVIFEIFPSIHIESHAVALSRGDDQVRIITFPRPGAAAEEVPHGGKLVMYGAARRGMIGVRVPSPDDNFGVMYSSTAGKSYETTGGGDRITNGRAKLSFGGDCGALYLGEEGTAWCMHTTFQGIPKENPSVWFSRGALLQHIVNRHAFYFGGDPNPISSNGSQSSPVNIALEKIIDPETEDQYPRLDFSQFNIQDSLFEKQRPLSLHRLPLYIPDGDDDDDADTQEDEKKRED